MECEAGLWLLHERWQVLRYQLKTGWKKLADISTRMQLSFSKQGIESVSSALCGLSVGVTGSRWYSWSWLFVLRPAIQHLGISNTVFLLRRSSASLGHVNVHGSFPGYLVLSITVVPSNLMVWWYFQWVTLWQASQCSLSLVPSLLLL